MINKKLLVKIKQHILEEPKRFAMASWVQRQNVYEPTVSDLGMCHEYNFPKCGTAACIGGWAVLLTTKHPELINNTSSLFDKGRYALRLNINQASRLFSVSSWPTPFYKAYIKAKTPRGKASTVARLIDHFLKTKGEF